MELQVRMNLEVKYTRDCDEYDSFRVHYDNVGQRFWFGNTSEWFELIFDRREIYNTQCKQPDMWNKSLNWGLPAYLGFNKCNYTSTECDEVIFTYNYPDIWLSPSDCDNKVYYVKANVAPNLMGERAIYMEVDTGNQTCNSITEFKPYTTNTNNLCNNEYNFKVNSAFAKIPIQNQPLGNLLDSRNGFLNNVKIFKGPLNISKLCFKFRYHDGRLVDFGNLPFNFTIEFNIVEQNFQTIGSIYNARVPGAYRL